MPGYYNWKLRNCTAGAAAAAELLRQTIEALDADYLHPLWSAGNGSFPADVDAVLAAVVAEIDAAEEALLRAKLKAATLFPGGPEAARRG